MYTHLPKWSFVSLFPSPLIATAYFIYVVILIKPDDSKQLNSSFALSQLIASLLCVSSLQLTMTS